MEFAECNLGGQAHICAFFNTMHEEHKMHGSIHKDGFDLGKKAYRFSESESAPKRWNSRSK